ncbi:MAG TPA: DUF2796 domain-containing protein [Dokdonella sp.]
MSCRLPRLACLIALALPMSSAFADDTAHRQHGPHVHGEARLNVGIDGALLLVSLDAPGMSLLGYEHPPRDDAERSAYGDTVAALNAPDGWLVLPPAAGCTLDAATVQAHGFDTANTHDDGSDPVAHGHEHEHGSHEHADFDASYRYTCHAPLALHAFEVKLIERFPALHKINVELVLPDRQGSQVLMPGRTTVLLSK